MTRILAVAVCLLPLIASADDAITRTVVRQQGQDGVHTYRIPGLATTKQGTLIAVFDNRNKNSVDLPTWWALGTRSGGEVVSSDSY